ncbi:MAG TPA: very short patch repair endonuclease [Verrucomicrobiae bacterium]|nr:very short patch repair endonuclease [Verrucomicrobiae bacterium]
MGKKSGRIFYQSVSCLTVDRISKAERSEVMSRIRGRGNERTETNVIKLFRNFGIKGWRRHFTIKLAGKTGVASDGTQFKPQVRPDFIFPKSKMALFIDGCFWHGCPRCYRVPKSRKKFWSAKVLRNKERDAFQRSALRRSGWRVFQVWECGLKPKFFELLAMKVKGKGLR